MMKHDANSPQLSMFASVPAAGTAETTALLAALPETLAPLVAWDNLLAIVACAAFYGMEVSAIMPILRDYKDSPKEAVRKSGFACVKWRHE
jgi:hypothetical protein